MVSHTNGFLFVFDEIPVNVFVGITLMKMQMDFCGII